GSRRSSASRLAALGPTGGATVMNRAQQVTGIVIGLAMLTSAFPCSGTSPELPQPSAPPAARSELPHFLKGYEIYSWQEPHDHWHFALLGGTNRLKSPSEISSAAISEAELRSRLAKLPALEDVAWCPPAELKMQPPLEIPPKQIVDSLLELAHRLNIHLS